MSELDLDRRTGWPADLRLFVRRRGSGSSATTTERTSSRFRRGRKQDVLARVAQGLPGKTGTGKPDGQPNLLSA